MNEERWWLIERAQHPDGKQFFTGPGVYAWTEYAPKAIRFPSKESAQDFLDHYIYDHSGFSGTPLTMRGYAFPVEHVWVNEPLSRDCSKCNGNGWYEDVLVDKDGDNPEPIQVECETCKGSGKEPSSGAQAKAICDACRIGEYDLCVERPYCFESRAQA